MLVSRVQLHTASLISHMAEPESLSLLTIQEATVRSRSALCICTSTLPVISPAPRLHGLLSVPQIQLLLPFSVICLVWLIHLVHFCFHNPSHSLKSSLPLPHLRVVCRPQRSVLKLLISHIETIIRNSFFFTC